MDCAGIVPTLSGRRRLHLSQRNNGCYDLAATATASLESKSQSPPNVFDRMPPRTPSLAHATAAHLAICRALSAGGWPRAYRSTLKWTFTSFICPRNKLQTRVGSNTSSNNRHVCHSASSRTFCHQSDRRRRALYTPSNMLLGDNLIALIGWVTLC